MVWRRRILHASKLSIGNIICSLVVFIPALRYPFSSFAPILYFLSTAMVADSVHIGANIVGALVTFSSGIFGSLLAAIVLFISPNDAAILSISCLIVIPACITLRFGKHPKIGILAALILVVFSINILRFRHTSDDLILQSVYYTILSSAIAGFVALFTMMSYGQKWASHEVPALLSKNTVVMGKWQLLTLMASNLLHMQHPEDHSENPFETDEMPRRRESLDMVKAHVESSHAQYHHKKPDVVTSGGSLNMGHELWLPLRSAAGLLNLYSFEQLFAAPLEHTLHERRAAVVAALNDVALKLTALQSVVGEGMRTYSDRTMMRFWVFVIDNIMYDFSALAAMLHKIGEEVARRHASPILEQSPKTDAMNTSTRDAFYAGVLRGFQNYWEKALTDEEESPGEEVRALLFTGILWRGVGDSIHNLQTSVDALSHARNEQRWSLLALVANFGVWVRLVLLPVFTWWDQLLRIRTILSWKSLRTWPDDYLTVFAFKLYVVVCVSMIVLILVSPLYSIMGDPYGGWVLVSLIVVMQPSIEATLQRFVFRVCATIAGSGLGYAIMSNADAATTPVIICVYMFCLMFIALLFLHSPYRYGIFVFCISMDIGILTQYGLPVTFDFALGRGTTVLIGATLGFLASLVLPYYASKKVTNSLKKAMMDASKLLLVYIDAYIDFGLVTNDNGEATWTTDPLRPGPCLVDDHLAAAAVSLETHMVTALSSTEAKIDKETVAWASGPLSLPSNIKQIITDLRVLTMRLAAFENAMRRPPLLTGSYGLHGSCPHKIYILPLLEEITRLKECQAVVLQALGEYLGNRTSATLKTALDAAREFWDARTAMLAKLYIVRKKHYDDLRLRTHDSFDPDHLPLDPDDTVLFCGFTFAWLSTMHAIVALIRTALPVSADLKFLPRREAFVRTLSSGYVGLGASLRTPHTVLQIEDPSPRSPSPVPSVVSSNGHHYKTQITLV